MRKVISPIAMFSIMGLIGPLISFIILPIFKPTKVISTVMYYFIYDLVILLWPSWFLAIQEISIGRPMALILAISTNIFLFSIIGLIVAIILRVIDRKNVAIYGSCIFVWVLVILWSLWGAGFNVSHINGYVLVIALSFYAIPFCIIKKQWRNNGVGPS